MPTRRTGSAIPLCVRAGRAGGPPAETGCGRRPISTACPTRNHYSAGDRRNRGKLHMTYVSKVLWLIAAPTSTLVLISASAALWAVVGSNCAVWLAAAAACGLAIGAFTPISVALLAPLEYRFLFSPPDSQASPDGIIVLGGSS